MLLPTYRMYLSLIYFPLAAFVATSPAPTSKTTTAKNHWRDGPCEILKSVHCPTGYEDTPPLLIVSLDGFRYDYFTRGKTPALDRIRTCGVHATSMRPSHPSVTFPNHYSIVTGLNTESHGIIDNKFNDPELGHFDNTKEVSHEGVWWEGGEPIWVTAKKQGKRANAMFWPGSEAPIKGVRPDIFYNFNSSFPFTTRVDNVLGWLSLPKGKRPDVTMMYFEEPDGAGHKYGPDLPGLDDALIIVDATIDKLMQGLEDRYLTSCVNIIIVSDHGMENVLCNERLSMQSALEASSLKGILNVSQVDFYGGVQGRLALSASAFPSVSVQDVYQTLQCEAPRGSSPYQIYKKEDLPRRLHYINSPRIEPIIMNMKAQHQVFSVIDGSLQCVDGGNHGYDNLYIHMQAIFLARGPSFKAALEIEPFRNIELYNLMCELVNVQPAPNNGTAGSMHQVLRTPKTLPRTTFRSDAQPRFPDSKEIKGRQNPKFNQACGNSSANSILAIDLRLSLLSPDSTTMLDKNLPFGIPEVNDKDFAMNVLVNRDSVIGYSNALQLPVWSGFSLDKTSKISGATFNADVTCLRLDVRLTPNATNGFQHTYNSGNRLGDIAISYLVPPVRSAAIPKASKQIRLYHGFPGKNINGISSSVENATVEQTTANIIPMYKSFKAGIWTTFWDIIGNWRIRLDGNFSIHLGPVFDDLSPYGLLDPLADISFGVAAGLPGTRLPSHYYVIITRSNQTKSCLSTQCLPEVMAFILPHKKEHSNCQDDRSYILTHSASVDDVEKVTGLKFYTKLPLYEAIRLRTMLPTKLWDSRSGLST